MGKAKKVAAFRPNPNTFRAGVDEVTAEPLVLIVVPTRELAVQIFNEARKLCYRTMLRPGVVYGGVHIAEQAALLNKGCDILVGTAGRLINFIERPNILTLRRLKYMILDEADEMLNQDWEEEVGKILTGGGKLSQLHFQPSVSNPMLQNRTKEMSSTDFSPQLSPRVLGIWPRTTWLLRMSASVLAVPDPPLPTFDRSLSRRSDTRSVIFFFHA